MAGGKHNRKYFLLNTSAATNKHSSVRILFFFLFYINLKSARSRTSFYGKNVYTTRGGIILMASWQDGNFFLFSSRFLLYIFIQTHAQYCVIDLKCWIEFHLGENKYKTFFIFFYFLSPFNPRRDCDCSSMHFYFGWDVMH